jgi:metacaspase-1
VIAGHGSQKADYTGEELDGKNETLLPTDYASAGQIIDDELNAALVRPIGPGVRLHALLDACHSGTGLDLPYETHVDHRTGSVTWHKAGRCAASLRMPMSDCSVSRS